MGVIAGIVEEANSQGQSDSTTEEQSASHDQATIREADPFGQHYHTERFSISSEKMDEMLSIAIAVGNLLP